MKSDAIEIGDALLVIDIQNDFLPGGSLAVSGSEQIIPAINRCIEKFNAIGNPIFLTRDWHPVDHWSFAAQSGPWPAHCVAGTFGAEFSANLLQPEKAQIISKGVRRESEGYSDFEAPDLQARLERAGIRRLFVAGLATDYCVLYTVLDALKLGYQVFLLQDAVRAVNVKPGDGDMALQTMRQIGAQLISSDLIS
ncbi:isochorismatase family protein [Methylomicrobium sp. Wu6]|uniref:isochorismatase family protein n=1 Tax=Methylomicrobium sp. Wu6 TaxID=3107928 RepID=UPI002DD634BC|nr:isochorismatase family protein [Methylomicrobium sp. Wu6]MEC4747866.1 isochorismatase family protein [Methylomicrobium sp. Wu6]